MMHLYLFIVVFYTFTMIIIIFVPMKSNTLTILLIFLLTLNVRAQEDTLRIVQDSLQIKKDIVNKSLSTPFQMKADERIDMPLPQLSKNSSIHVPIQKPSLLLPYYTNPSPLFKGDYNTGGLMFAHRHGILMGSGSQTTLPGIGRSNDASLAYIHSFNPQWTLTVGVDANKMHMNHFTGQSFGTSATLSYQATDRLTFNVFGGYNSGYVPGRQSYRYGGTIGFGMTEHFGMEMGVQRYYNPLRGGWETVPIAIPYYKFNNGAKMGLDVGGLIYQIFRNASFKGSVKSGARPNPTIAPQGPRIEIR